MKERTISSKDFRRLDAMTGWRLGLRRDAGRLLCAITRPRPTPIHANRELYPGGRERAIAAIKARWNACGASSRRRRDGSSQELTRSGPFCRLPKGALLRVFPNMQERDGGRSRWRCLAGQAGSRPISGDGIGEVGRGISRFSVATAGELAGWAGIASDQWTRRIVKSATKTTFAPISAE